MKYLSCKFRSGIECCEYGEACDKCGWNPIVEAQREKKLESCEVGSYLKFDFKKMTNQMEYMQRRNRAMIEEGEDDG